MINKNLYTFKRIAPLTWLEMFMEVDDAAYYERMIAEHQTWVYKAFNIPKGALKAVPSGVISPDDGIIYNLCIEFENEVEEAIFVFSGRADG